MGGFCPVPMQSVPITTNIVSSNPTQYNIMQGFQSGLVLGTFTHLRSCIVPAEITEPPPKLAVVKTTSTIGLWNIFHKKLMITSIAEFSHSNRPS